jgi:hypothetical protein
MGRLIPAGTGLPYYRHVEIVIVEEEPIQEPDPLMEGIPGYDEEARTLYVGGLSEDTSAPGASEDLAEVKSISVSNKRRSPRPPGAGFCSCWRANRHRPLGFAIRDSGPTDLQTK